MLRFSSRKYIEARARRINISRVNVASVSGLEPPLEPSTLEPVNLEESPELAQAPQADLNAHPFFWKESDGSLQKDPSEIRWVWNPMTGDLHIGTQDRHSEMTPRDTDWESVLRGFYFPAKKLVAIRPFYWPDGTYDQWDEGHAELSADVQMTFVMAMQPTLQQQDPEVEFKTNIDNKWLQGTTGRYSW